MIQNAIKNKFWVISIPVTVIVILSMASIKEIENAQVQLDYGKKISYYLRTSTDSLTYYAIAYTSTKDTSFLNQFNNHLNNRKLKKFVLDDKALKYYNQGLRLSNELANQIENPAFKQMDNKAFFTPLYIDYKDKIFKNIDSLRTIMSNDANEKLEREVLFLNIYIYSLCITILILIMFIRFKKESKAPLKKAPKKK